MANMNRQSFLQGPNEVREAMISGFPPVGGNPAVFGLAERAAAMPGRAMVNMGRDAGR